MNNVRTVYRPVQCARCAPESGPSPPAPPPDEALGAGGRPRVNRDISYTNLGELRARLTWVLEDWDRLTEGLQRDATHPADPARQVARDLRDIIVERLEELANDVAALERGELQVRDRVGRLELETQELRDRVPDGLAELRDRPARLGALEARVDELAQLREGLKAARWELARARDELRNAIDDGLAKDPANRGPR